MKKTFKFLFAAGLLSMFLLTNCNSRDNEAMDSTEDNSTYDQDYPGVGTDGNETGSHMADTNSIEDGSVDGIKGKSTNPNLP